MKVVYTRDHLQHNPEHEFETSTAHSPYEHPGRAEAIARTLADDSRFEFVTPTPHGRAPITDVHAPGLVDFLEGAWSAYQAANGAVNDVVPDVFFHPRLRNKMGEGRAPQTINGQLGYWTYETTTPITETTFSAAVGAVDTALTATDAVLAGDRVAYGLCRPPGHHASTSLFGGYCFFNNAAVAAHHAVNAGHGKVTILDVDYHHGNGTQEIFYDRDDVQYVSLHGDPARAYPYHTGFADEEGTGRGAGSNLNVPLPVRADDGVYLDALHRACQAITSFGPDVLIVSLGVDTFEADPIADLGVTTEGFGLQGVLVAELGLPTVVLQEGGYNVDAIGANVWQFLNSLSGIDR